MDIKKSQPNSQVMKQNQALSLVSSLTPIWTTYTDMRTRVIDTTYICNFSPETLLLTFNKYFTVNICFKQQMTIRLLSSICPLKK